MSRPAAKSERVAAFSDGVIAVIITIMVLELKPPAHPTFAALRLLWPTLLSYVVSYLFVAIVWVNHHHLLRYAESATAPLIWSNLGFLFTVSLVPFATAWLADTRLAAVPMAVYAAVFVLVNISYLFLENEAMRQAEADGALLRGRARRYTHARSVLTLIVFGVSLVLALYAPRSAFVLLCACVLSYLSPGSLACSSEDAAQPMQNFAAPKERED